MSYIFHASLKPSGQEHTLAACPNCGCNLTAFKPFDFGNVGVDPRGDIFFQGQIVRMPRTQRDVAEALIRGRGRCLSRGVLVNVLGADINDSTISKYIERTRRIFRTLDPSFDQIEAVRGYGGYRWIYRERSAARLAA